MTAVEGVNYSLRDEIRDYWSRRAETFDLSPGHEIFSDEERVAWHRLIAKHLGEGGGRDALDLACGTGVVSHLMHDLGFKVSGLDWSEAMLAKARAKSRTRGSNIRFVMGDAERTMEPAASYDVIVTRHLVWTLVDPAAAFAEWFSLLKPGGRLLIVDGDFVSRTWFSKLRKLLERDGFMPATQMPAGGERGTHESILSRVYFSNGARAPQIAELLRQAGFGEPVIDYRLKAIHRAQGRNMEWIRYLERATQHRYAVCATKPA